MARKVVRLAILARRTAHDRRDTLDRDGLRHRQFKVLLTLRRLGPPYTASRCWRFESGR